MIDAKSIVEKVKSKQSAEEFIFRMHHVLMKTYGWIPLDEFLKLPAQTALDLLNCIEQDAKDEMKAMKKK